MVRTRGARTRVATRVVDLAWRIRCGAGKGALMMGRVALLAFSLGMAGVYFLGARRAFPQAADAAHKTTYYLHGRIYTNDPKMPWASALAVRDDKIFCIGSIEHIMLDLGGSQFGGGVMAPEGGVCV